MSSTKKKANNNEVLLPPFVPFPSSLLVPPPHLLLLLPQFLLLLIAFSAGSGEAALLQGCDFGDELCDDGELCIPDGLFGQCYSDSEAVLVRPLILDTPLSDAQSQVLRAELGRLAANGLDWPHARAQCVLAYFKLAVAFQLDYDTEFCTVRDPANIWALVQRVQNALLAEEEGEEQSGDELAEWGQGNAEGAEEEEEGAQQPEGRPEEVQLIPVVLLGQQEEKPDGYELALAGGTTALRSNRTGAAEKRRADEEPDGWEAGDQTEMDEMLGQLLANRPPQVGTAGSLNDRQLARLVQFIRQLQSLLQANVVQRAAEEEMAAADLDETDMEDGEVDKRQGQQVFLLKKDMERFNNADMGLANTVHKIVKGGIQRVEGNRVYLRVTAKENLTEEELYKLIAYLDRKIAAPNRLYFDQFLYENGQLSFRVLRSPPPSERANDEKSAVHLDSASGVAQAVYKRRKDIQTLAGVRVDETGIGSGQDVVPLERSQRDQLFLPILAVCALTICALLSVLAASLISRRRHKAGGAPLLPQTIDQAGGAANKQSYEQLCRQRAADSPPQGVAIVEAGGGGGVRSKHSSSSSWPGDEPAPAAISLDIGTGHVLLAFLRKHLDQPAEMTSQWQSVCDYAAADMQTAAAMKPENADSNLDGTVLPYDESRVQLHSAEVLVELAGGEKPEGDGTYINASKIYDSDPENPAYIAAQAPLESTVARFWQMIWEQGIGLLVNLCDRQETESGVYFKYWPAEGSRTFGTFEVHLVSEHIWSEHYLVRSLYLKNTGTQETRTVTQFHFLSWAAGGVPGSNKALLEFRRKVNKSYRGRASPVLVHCSNGAGRTGTYILIDMTANRINKGVKEVNIAASLEHLRDQRMGMVENEQQFKCVFSCVADEISALLRGLQH